MTCRVAAQRKIPCRALTVSPLCRLVGCQNFIDVDGTSATLRSVLDLIVRPVDDLDPPRWPSPAIM